MPTMGKNVTYEVNGDKLTIEVDLSKSFGPSSTGKTIVVATSGGNILVPEYEKKQIKIGLNVNTK